jgi:hypothetical protein
MLLQNTYLLALAIASVIAVPNPKAEPSTSTPTRKTLFLNVVTTLTTSQSHPPLSHPGNSKKQNTLLNVPSSNVAPTTT